MEDIILHAQYYNSRESDGCRLILVENSYHLLNIYYISDSYWESYICYLTSSWSLPCEIQIRDMRLPIQCDTASKGQSWVLSTVLSDVKVNGLLISFFLKWFPGKSWGTLGYEKSPEQKYLSGSSFLLKVLRDGA